MNGDNPFGLIFDPTFRVAKIPTIIRAMNSRQFFPWMVLFPVTSLLLLAKVTLAETLTTANYRITITHHCPEEHLTCQNVSYQSTHRHTGASVRLTGQTVHTPCADGGAPCRFIGYEFRQGNYRYFVTHDRLQVYHGSQLLLVEKGTWDY